MQETLRLEAFWPYRLMRMAEILDRAFGAICGPDDELSFSEWQVLWCLALTSPGTAKSIALRCGMSKTKISRAVKVLEDRAYITRRRDRSDRRFELLALTPEGFSRFGRLEERARHFQTVIETSVAHADLASLNDGLQGVEEMLASGRFDQVVDRVGGLHNDHHTGS